MSIPHPNNREDLYVCETVMEELNSKKSRPLPEFAKSVQEAAWIRFRIDTILEEWLFSKTGEKIQNSAGFYSKKCAE